MRPERRSFLARLAKASAAAAGVTGVYALLRGRSMTAAGGPPAIPDYRVGLGHDGPTLAVVDAADAEVAVTRAIEGLGGMGRFVRPGDRVLIKPNVGFDRAPSFGATTSPEVVAAVIRLCRAASAREVWVADNPINNPLRCFAVSQVGHAVERAGGTVKLPSPGDMGPVAVDGVAVRTWEGLARLLLDANRLIGIPTVKDHNLAGVSVTMKNWYGFLGGARNAFHQKLDIVIADLAAAFVPTLVVVDGTRALIRNGPTGGRSSDVIATEKVAAGTDQVALDAWAAELMGRRPSDVPSIVEAQHRGLGTSDWRRLNPVMG